MELELRTTAREPSRTILASGIAMTAREYRLPILRIPVYHDQSLLLRYQNT